jgi:hypothetical protein
MADTYNLSIDAGATYLVEYEFTNQDGSVFNLTGYTAKMQIRDMPTSPTLVLEVIPTITILTGIISVTLTATQTSALTNSKYVYAMELYGAGGYVLRPIEGIISMSPEVVR